MASGKNRLFLYSSPVVCPGKQHLSKCLDDMAILAATAAIYAGFALNITQDKINLYH
jgi:hypothetical protein